MKKVSNEQLGKIVELTGTKGNDHVSQLDSMDREVVHVSREAAKRIDNISEPTSSTRLPSWGSFIPPVPKQVLRPLALAGFLGDIFDSDE